MPDLSVEHTAIVDQLVARLGRSTLPVQQAHTAEPRGTAFWFNELLDATPGRQVVKQYLVTADALTRCDLGELLLRPQLCEPVANAEVLLLPGFADLWRPAGDLGVAVLPTDGLHAHGNRKGWRWTTDEITDGLAARDADIAAISTGPATVFVLGHGVRQPAGAPPAAATERPQTVLLSSVSRCRHGALHLSGDVPEGLVGAPVFSTTPRTDGNVTLHCLGLVLPGTANNRVATFDRIRRALRSLPEPSEAPRRRWGRRSAD